MPHVPIRSAAAHRRAQTRAAFLDAASTTVGPSARLASIFRWS